MDTRWKNIKKILEEEKEILGGLIFGALGVLIMCWLYRESSYLITKHVWAYGILADFFIGCSVILLLDSFLQRKYNHWKPKDDSFYVEWKQEWRKQQRYLVLVTSVILLGAVFFLIFMIRTRLYEYGYVVNYAFAYLLIFTVMFLFGLAQWRIIRFMRSRLNLLMDVVYEINKERLAEAVEIERRSLEKAARSEQLKVDLISNVSHDLKTPLTSMVGYLELLKKENLDDISRDYVDVISDKAEKLKIMIESLFSLAKASSGNIQMEIEPIELNRLVEQLLADMESQITESKLHVVKLLTTEKTCFLSDNIHMYRICQNLLENALKYSAKGTRVFVETFVEASEAGESVCLEITNTAGYYMDFNKEDIIERFARGDKARTSEGNGLGLAIVSTYTSALGGSFDIHINCDQFKVKLTFPAVRDRESETAI